MSGLHRRRVSLLVVALFPATLANILDIANADHPPASP